MITIVRVPRATLCALLAICWMLPLFGCGVSSYETTLQESVKSRRKHLQIARELEQRAAENPDSGPQVDYENMSDEELDAELEKLLQRGREAYEAEQRGELDNFNADQDDSESATDSQADGPSPAESPQQPAQPEGGNEES